MNKTNKIRSNSSKPSIINEARLIQKDTILIKTKLFSSNSQPSKSQQPLARQSEIDLTHIVKLFAAHYTAVEDYFKIIEQELTKLQAKISDLSGKFNQIEWKLSKGANQLHESHLLNEQLLKINNEIEEKLNTLKTDYEDLKKRKYISNIEKRIEELKQYTHKLQMEQYRNKFNKQEWVIFDDNIEKLQQLMRKGGKGEKGIERQVYNEIIRDLIGFIKGRKGDISQWLEEKILENIALKIDLIKNSTIGSKLSASSQAFTFSELSHNRNQLKEDPFPSEQIPYLQEQD